MKTRLQKYAASLKDPEALRDHRRGKPSAGKKLEKSFKEQTERLLERFAARPDAELSLPVRAERDLDCLECLTQRRCFWHAPAVPRGEVNDSEYGRLVTSLEGSFRG